MSMRAVADEADPARGAGRARLRQVWSGGGRIDRPGDVAAVLSEVRRAATDRLLTSEALTLVERGSEMPRPETLDPRHALPVPAELEQVLGGGLRRGSVVAAAGSGSLLLSLIGAAHGAGAWAAVMGHQNFGATAAPEFAVDLARVALIPDPGDDWAGVAAVLIAGLELLVLYPPGAVPAGVASRLQARARKSGCVLVVVDPAAGAQAWPGPDVVLEAVGHRVHGLGAGRGRLRRHEVQVRVARRHGQVTAPVWVPMPPPSLAAIARPQPGSVPDFGLPDGWPAVRHTPDAEAPPVLRPVPAPSPASEPDPWADHLIDDAVWAQLRSRTA